MKNIFYYYDIKKIGGIESFFYYLAKKYKDWDITIYYTIADAAQVERLSKYVRVQQYQGEEIECEKAFLNFRYKDIINNIHAKEYNYLIHSDYKDMVDRGQLRREYIPIDSRFTHYYGVSQIACDNFKKLTGITPILCYNPIVLDPPKHKLKLISATRLTIEKGRERMVKLMGALNTNHIDYEWTIYTDDRNKINDPHIVYQEPTLDIIPHIAESDYLVQLSDNEGYCYSVIEALMCGTPVIVTDLPVFKELNLNDSNSIRLSFDMKDIPIDKIVARDFDFQYEPKKDIWGEILAAGDSVYQEELNTIYEVEALPTYEDYRIKDQELNRVPKAGEHWTVTKARLDVLNGKNSKKTRFVKLVNTYKKDELSK